MSISEYEIFGVSEMSDESELTKLQRLLDTERLKCALLHDAAIISRRALTQSHPTAQHEAHKQITRLLDQVAWLEARK